MMSQLLKEQTRPLHKAVEALNPVLTPQFTTHFYKNYLSLLAAYYDHFETQFEKWNSVVPSELQLLRRMKLEKIKADLKNLGACKGQLKFEIPPISTRAEFWDIFMF